MPTHVVHITIDRKKPKWIALADGIRTAISTGRLKPGEQLPSSRTLALQTGIHRQTVMIALEELAAEGWIVSRERSRYLVNHRLPDLTPRQTRDAATGKAPRLPANPVRHHWRLQMPPWIGKARDPLSHPALHAKIAMQSGLPDLKLFPMEEFQRCLSRAARDSRESDLTWGQPTGATSLTHAIGQWLRLERAITGRSILVTNGSQEAIDLTSRVLLCPGDRVAVEHPGYPPAWSAFARAGAKLMPIGVDQQGIDPDLLYKTLRQNQIRLIYLTPLHQYPTTVTLSVDRRIAVYRLAEKFGVPIFEDDYDHEFHYASQPLAPMAAEDEAGLVLYTSSFTKMMFPSLRLGFMALPPEVASAFHAAKDVTTRHTSTLPQIALADWMNNGGFGRHVRRMTRVYEERLGVLTDSLQKLRSLGHDLNWSTPAGGMALWLTTPFKADRLSELALAQGLFLHSGQDFQMNSKPCSYSARLGFACLPPERIRAAVQLLGKSMG